MIDRKVSNKMNSFHCALHVVIIRRKRKLTRSRMCCALYVIYEFAIIIGQVALRLVVRARNVLVPKQGSTTNKQAWLDCLPSSRSHFFPSPPTTTHYSASQHRANQPCYTFLYSVCYFSQSSVRVICLYNRRVNCLSTPWFTRLVRDLQRACGSSRALVPVTIPLHSA